MKIKIIKCHGSGNDFILIDIRNLNNIFYDEIKSGFAVKLCNRKKSIGADGILYITESQIADCKMRIFNSDGSEAEMCGNGIRIVGRYMSEEKKQAEVTVENVTGLNYKIHKSNEFFEDVVAYEVQLPPAIFECSDIPINTKSNELFNSYLPEISNTLKFSAVAMPNPHIIAFVDDIDINNLEQIGKKANSNNTLFPNGVNVSLVQSINEETIYVATFERGVGITYSCGTAMCASAICSVKNGISSFGNKIKVLNKGGFINVVVESDWSCKMTGNATYVFEANLEFDLMKKEKLDVYKGNAFIDEILAYVNLVESVEKQIT